MVPMHAKNERGSPCTGGQKREQAQQAARTPNAGAPSCRAGISRSVWSACGLPALSLVHGPNALPSSGLEATHEPQRFGNPIPLPKWGEGVRPAATARQRRERAGEGNSASFMVRMRVRLGLGPTDARDPAFHAGARLRPACLARHCRYSGIGRRYHPNRRGNRSNPICLGPRRAFRSIHD